MGLQSAHLRRDQSVQTTCAWTGKGTPFSLKGSQNPVENWEGGPQNFMTPEVQKPSIPQETGSSHYTKTHSVCVHTNSPTPTHVAAHLTSCLGGATPPSQELASSSPSSSFLLSRQPHNSTGDFSASPMTLMTSWHAHQSRGQRTGNTLTSRHAASVHPTGTAQPCNATPNRKHKTAGMYTHKLHREWGTPTSLIKHNFFLSASG